MQRWLNWRKIRVITQNEKNINAFRELIQSCIREARKKFLYSKEILLISFNGNNRSRFTSQQCELPQRGKEERKRKGKGREMNGWEKFGRETGGKR